MTIHVVDPVGLETLMTSPLGGATNDTIVTRQADLHAPADISGGRTVLNTNAPEAAVPAILDESQHYYLLGFASSDAQGPAFHKIEVKVNRPNVELRYRTEYTLKPTKAPPARTNVPAPVPIKKKPGGGGGN